MTSKSKRKLAFEAAARAPKVRRFSENDVHDEIMKEQKEDIKKLRGKLLEYENAIKTILSVDPNDCCNWKFADRQDFELGDIEELAEDIKRNGQVQPVILRPVVDNREFSYEVIAGERRWRACKKLGINLLAEIQMLSDADAIIVQKSENRKKSVSPYSEAKQYYEALKQEVISQNKLAERIGYSSSGISNLLSFMHVPKEVWLAVNDMTRVSARTAKTIKILCDEGQDYVDAIIDLAPKIRNGMGGVSIERAVKERLNPTLPKKVRHKVIHRDKDLFDYTDKGELRISSKIVTDLDLKKIAKKFQRILLEEIESSD